MQQFDLFETLETFCYVSHLGTLYHQGMTNGLNTALGSSGGKGARDTDTKRRRRRKKKKRNGGGDDGIVVLMTFGK